MATSIDEAKLKDLLKAAVAGNSETGKPGQACDFAISELIGLLAARVFAFCSKAAVN
jgi:hypothetical protein